MFWELGKGNFQFFFKFWVMKLKTFSGKKRQNIKNCLNQNLVIGSIIENGFESTLSWKMFWAFENSSFQFFPNFWVKKFKPFSGKVRQNIKNYLNQNLVMGSFLENGFGAPLRSKTNFLGVWKGKFSFFQNFWVTKLKLFSGKARKSLQEHLNSYEAF